MSGRREEMKEKWRWETKEKRGQGGEKGGVKRGEGSEKKGEEERRWKRAEERKRIIKRGVRMSTELEPKREKAVMKYYTSIYYFC